jgi:hypothetical protein
LVVLGLHAAVYTIVRANLRDQIDESLRDSAPGEHGVTADQMLTGTSPQHLPITHQAYLQLVDSRGEIVAAFDDRTLPVTNEVLAVARGERDEAFFDADIDGTPVRVYATPAEEGTASKSAGH